MMISKNSIVRCAKSQAIDTVSLEKNDLIYSCCALKNFISIDEKTMMLDAEITTYPTKFLIRQFSKMFADQFKYKTCWFSTKLAKATEKNVSRFDKQLFKYDVKSKRTSEYEITDTIGGLDQCLVKSHCDNIENDIAGTITFIVNPNDCGDKKIKDQFQHESILQKFIELGDRLGYDFVAYDISDEKYNTYYIYIKYEAKYQDAQITIQDDLYHVAPKSIKDKILRFGLNPKSNSSNSGKNLRHSDRVYLFNGYNKNAITSFIEQSGKMSNKYSQFFRLLAQTKEYSIFRIDRSKISGLKLYRDNMFQSKSAKKPTAIYTYSNIRPDAIEFVKDIAINQPGL